MEKLLLTPVEAAEALGVGRSMVYQLLQRGHLRSVRISACHRIPMEVVHECITGLPAAS